MTEHPTPPCVTINLPDSFAMLALRRLFGLGAADVQPILNSITNLKQELQVMSASLTQQLSDGINALTAKIDASTASLNSVAASVTDLDGDVKALKVKLDEALATVSPGTTLTQEQVDMLNSVVTSAGDLADKSAALAASAQTSADQFPGAGVPAPEPVVSP